jgi:hypothetical protein
VVDEYRETSNQRPARSPDEKFLNLNWLQIGVARAAAARKSYGGVIKNYRVRRNFSLDPGRAAAYMAIVQCSKGAEPEFQTSEQCQSGLSGFL